MAGMNSGITERDSYRNKLFESPFGCNYLICVSCLVLALLLVCWNKSVSFWSCSGSVEIVSEHLYNIGWPGGGYKNILPEMLTMLPESKTRAILLALRAIYSCIPRKRVIQYYHYYPYIGLCVSSYYLTIVSDCRLPFCLFTNRALFMSHNIAGQ